MIRGSVHSSLTAQSLWVIAILPYERVEIYALMWDFDRLFYLGILRIDLIFGQENIAERTSVTLSFVTFPASHRCGRPLKINRDFPDSIC